MSEPLLRPVEGGKLAFFCPGCKCGHWVDGRWTVSGTPEAPTINPSVLCRTPRNGPHTEGMPPEVCHLFVREGRIEFLGDCTHELAGQTVLMEPL